LVKRYVSPFGDGDRVLPMEGLVKSTVTRRLTVIIMLVVTLCVLLDFSLWIDLFVWLFK
jgi:hypothetical protein